jgi:preprotein translocase subunit SecD
VVTALAVASGLTACGSGSRVGTSGGTSESGSHGRLVRVTMKAAPLAGTEIGPSALAQLQAILDQRLSAADVSDAKVSISGDLVTISAPAVYSSVVQSMGETALLRFRQVLEVGAWAPTPVASVSPAAFVQSQSGASPLPGSESADLSSIEKSFASWDRSKHANPTNGDDDPTDYVIACASDKTMKYLLAPAAVEGSQVGSVEAGPTSNGVGWQINLMFDGSGSAAWLHLTKTAYDATGSFDSGFGTCAPPKGCNAVAIVLDGVVQSSPAIVSAGGIPGGQAQITGNFTQQQTQILADQIKYGSLPLKLEITDVTTTS